MKQTLVVKIDMHDAKSRSKAMKIAVGIPGVISAKIDADKDQLTVVGDGVDSVYLTTRLRKRMVPIVERLLCLGMISTELVSVTPEEEKKKEEEKKPENVTVWPYQWHPAVVPSHIIHEAPRNDGCSIM